MRTKCFIVNQLRRLNYQFKIRFYGDCQRIYHHHIRKTAGTSLNAAFWNLVGLDLRQTGRLIQIRKNGLVFAHNDCDLINQGNYFYASSHQPAYRLCLPDKTFTITILRDPLERLISYYRYLSFVKNDPGAAEYEPFFGLNLWEAECLGNSFEDFLSQVPKHDLLTQLFMFSENYDVDEATDRILQCSAICFTETFTQDFEQLRRRLHLPLVEQREHSIQHSIHITDRELDYARDALRAEYKLIENIKHRLQIPPITFNALTV